MNDHLSLHQLKLFCAVVENGSYVDTAKQLMMTQPALSLQVKSLQMALGTRLFERRSNRLVLTETGRLTYELARNILALEQRLKSTVKDLMHADHGSISIGSFRPFGRYFIPYIVSEYLQQFEYVDVSVVYKDTETIYNHVLNRILDVGVVASDDAVPVPPGLRTTKLRHDHWCLVSSPDRPWIEPRRIDKALFQRAPLITAVSHSTHWKLIQKILSNLGLRPSDYTIRLRMDDLESIKVVVLRGLGIAFLPYTSVQSELATGRLVEYPFPDGHPPLNCVIVTLDSRSSRPTVQRFVEFVLERFPLSADSKEPEPS
ncbi:MAG: LysR family transcriptional regulator [Alicyclobacillus macrosporangiidus]|uniref:LysR family transcriptional regulator n=1 Tax=Alicyclobacillus macrosporangiidus TaxID=392015 RepID=UPI0026EE2673|nr:LysR family transcriptional regulator [Alicyclobacillus macrosporangiidus]MCL6598123.1 LysR family transcriptional regulator [Alicyclobacillus macrosporangiidus]